MCPLIVTRQRLSKNVTAATNTRNSRRIAGRVVFHAVHVDSRKAGDYFFLELLDTVVVEFSCGTPIFTSRNTIWEIVV
jgi:hypothetical protein